MMALVFFPVTLLATVIHVAIRWPAWAALSGFTAGWWWSDFLKALIALGATP